VVICLERGADLHMAQLMPLPPIVSCFNKIEIGFTFLVPADPGSPVQRAVKRVCVCVWLVRHVWYGQCCEKKKWVKKCTKYEVEGPRPRGKPKRTWRKVVERLKDCQACKLNKKDDMDHSRQKELTKECLMIKMGVSGRMYLLVLLHLGSLRRRAIKWLRVRVCG